MQYEKVVGPIKGFYIAALALRVEGSEPRSYRARFKITTENTWYFAADALIEGTAEHWYTTPDDALWSAQVLASKELADFPDTDSASAAAGS